MSVYKTQQHLPPWLRWSLALFIAGIMTVGMLAGAFDDPEDKGQLLGMLISILGSLLGILVIFSLRLDLKMNRDGIEYRMFPLEWKTRTIQVSEIESMEVRKFRRFPGYGGFGKRRKPWKKEIAYLLNWKAGLFITLKNGRRRIFSTDNPQKLEQFIRNAYPGIIQNNPI
jgi:hypothetical protein